VKIAERRGLYPAKSPGTTKHTEATKITKKHHIFFFVSFVSFVSFVVSGSRSQRD